MSRVRPQSQPEPRDGGRRRELIRRHRRHRSRAVAVRVPRLMKFADRVIYAEKRILGAFYEGLLTFSKDRAADFIRAASRNGAPEKTRQEDEFRLGWAAIEERGVLRARKGHARARSPREKGRLSINCAHCKRRRPSSFRTSRRGVADDRSLTLDRQPRRVLSLLGPATHLARRLPHSYPWRLQACWSPSLRSLSGLRFFWLAAPPSVGLAAFPPGQPRKAGTAVNQESGARRSNKREISDKSGGQRSSC
ncbi:hypothetical protein MTO96_002913 [Rhipicephalus appendiculatus]